jgi:acetyl/propionyl-CoA carboxylase alpha subunit
VQRRYQKLIEEAPSPFMTEELRRDMGAAAVRLIRSVGYDSVGTCEFLVDAERRFYFLEMNVRLQVEHPVTEMATGIDLVRTQLRVAGGEKIPFRQDDVSFRGHAIEARICAEDPDNGFLPSVGVVTECDFPGGPGVRVDSGLHRGQEVSLYYDPILAKVIAHGDTRDSARRRLGNALAETRIAGVSTTAPFLRELLSFADFAEGRYDTTVITRFMESRSDAAPERRIVAAVAAAALRHRDARRSAAFSSAAPGRTGSENPWVVEGRRRGLSSH